MKAKKFAAGYKAGFEDSLAGYIGDYSYDFQRGYYEGMVDRVCG